jgi:hypothetical protein
LLYLLYGLAVETDRPLPGLAPAEAPGPPDLRMWLGSIPRSEFPHAAQRPWYASPRVTVGEEPSMLALRDEAGGYRLRYADGIEFRVDAGGTRIACAWPADLALEDAATYLLGSLFGFVLRLRGVSSLHASAVAIGDRSVSICGPAGSGKSTTAAAFAARGRPVLADDVVPLLERADGVYAHPAYPHLRLWPDVLPALYGSADLPPLTPGWDKRWRDLAADGAFHPAPLPLGAVYVLGGREAEDAPRLEPVAPVDAVLTLVSNTYMGWLPDPAARARDLALFGRMARSVPVVLAYPHTDPRRVGDLCEAIEADFAARTAAAGGARA